MAASVKRELLDASFPSESTFNDGVSKAPLSVIELSSSSESESDDDSDEEETNGFLGGFANRDGVSSGGDGGLPKKRKLNESGVVLPVGFLQPLLLDRDPEVVKQLPGLEVAVRSRDPNASLTVNGNGSNIKQFWKAGDYEGAPCGDWNSSSVGMDHVRVHPKFLHSNATSHKWALGAFAELLDNSLDEVCNGATIANVDMLLNKKDGNRMLLIEDNGGGMDPDKMRQCMSLGYSAKSKIANTIGQYGNGFKTSTMRLGADVIVFSRCRGRDGKSPTQSIGLLSYTFLRSTGKEDIVVPMLDYERGGGEWKKMVRSSIADWDKNLETIVQWSPFNSEGELLRQFHLMKDHGTRVIIYNLWEDDQGQLELDFDADAHDIQIRGVNRDEKNIQMAKQFPNSRHFLTYRHSLRSYASILYLRLPPGFRVILRGKDVEHHNIVNDMMLSQEVTYRPQPGLDGVPKETNMVAVVTIGFVKDARHHIDVQGFNVYHKNRLIKPFWRLWNAAGSDGRGVIGVLEANFVEPAHDKQGFERTTVLARLEARLVQMQKTYWSSNCHKIGYAPRNKKIAKETPDRDSSPDYIPHTSSQSRKTFPLNSSKADKSYSQSSQKHRETESRRPRKPEEHGNGNGYVSEVSDDTRPEKRANGSSGKTFTNKFVGKDGLRTPPSSYLEDTGSQQETLGERVIQPTSQSFSKDNGHALSCSDLQTLEKLKEENLQLKERLEREEGDILGELMRDLQFERDRRKTLETKLQAAEEKIDELNKEQESLIDIFSEERDRRDNDEANLRKKLQDASSTIEELRDKIRLLEKMKAPNGR